ncbi:polymorphic toxin-type HINT domain-containing protein [Luteimicrobium subarcticum]|uniref:Intein n=1 Tax=Luteimicrobium subarcticum TaxID=620910 RepID=A0A2M8WJ29_9MICO|nr:polymorphic toxin-type HINT domain-containing protein [Luteimicrobium subarcticum]PJI90922.1 intein [Luteimicrobium subarcticum]
MGLDIDPTPGDPVLVLAGGRDYLDVATAIDDAASALERLSVDGTVSAAMDAVMDRKEDVIADIRKAHGRYEAAGSALVDYAGVLDRVQSDTLAALNKAIDALDESADATGTKSRWQQLADDTTDPHEKTVYQHKADVASDRVSVAHGVVNAAKGDIDTAVADRDRAADNAIAQITDITAHDDLNDSWWDDWGSKVVAAIADRCRQRGRHPPPLGILAIVVAFIPVVGTALAGVLLVVAAVAAIVSALANIALAATGERSWTEAGIAIAGAALSVIGLGAAAKAATGISKVALKAGARESLAGLKGLAKGGIKNGLEGFGRKAACKVGFGTCFTAGTLIRTPDGDRPIETLRAGDKVYTHVLTAGVDVIETVEETFVRTTTTLYRLSIAGQPVTTTDEHPFMVHGLGWIAARDLRPGDQLVTGEDTDTGEPAGSVRLDAIDIEHVDPASAVETDADGGVPVYNIHVRAFHTYYVLAGDTAVLVHNANTHGAGRIPRTFEDCSDAAYQGVLHVRDEIAREGAAGSHSWASKMTDDELADYLDGYADIAAKGGGTPLKSGGVGWYDHERGVMIIYRNEVSMSTYSVTAEQFAKKAAH